MSEEGWTWQFRRPAKRTYDSLDPHAQDRITDKLDEIVNSEGRSAASPSTTSGVTPTTTSNP